MSYYDTIFFELHSVILMQYFGNITDQGIPLHEQQQTISCWPQNPQSVMDFTHPIEVMQIEKVKSGFLCPFTFASRTHLPA
jgi:hypothetical protein